MITKEVTKKPVAAAAPAAAIPAPAAAPPAVVTSAATPAAAVPSPAPVQQDFVTADGLAALTGMGFPEAESRAALIAAMGNPDLAYEFLLTGIPERSPAQQQLTAAAQPAVSAPAAAQPAASAPAAAAPAAGANGIEQLRQHPQFNMLKQLVQTNPAALPQVLDLIGQQSPELLTAIQANNDAFVAMMNEPIDNSAPATAPPAAAPPAAAPPAVAAGPPAGANMAAMVANMPAEQRAAFAQTVGMTPEQLEGFMQMMAQIPPAELQNMLAGMPGMGGMMPGAPGGADAPGTIQLTEEEMAAVTRLMDLGFPQQQAAQAYLACDKDEAMAANLLFDGWGGDDGGDFGGMDGDYGDDEGY